MKSTAGYDQNDQRASIFMDYYIPKGGIDIYFEWGKNDYNSGLDNLIRYPFHTQAITAGLKKSIDFISLVLLLLDKYIGVSLSDEILGTNTNLADSLNTILTSQNNTYNKMTENGWYSIDNIDKNVINQTLSKIESSN